MPVIASTSRGADFAAKPAIFLRFLALFAVVLMPIGMSPVAAAPMHQRAASAAAATMEHCADHGAQPQHKSAYSSDCAGCVAVVTLAGPFAEQIEAPAMQPRRRLADLRLGLVPEIATPPPKAS